ncbi:hypothetical protein NLG97_g828 [Lecanicillium saksenae]|uniref:Uncharacterized protein n=1 Tax=Lecanicillium saksenae TaxID=468837 RepID=A0ACC1R7D2_9HYPO|nr:hypothetical protein NLG97_g828 [Lecanicillium saksenae]
MAMNSAAFLCAASALTLYHGLFAIIVIALPKNATIARSVSALLISAAAFLVSRYAIGLVQPLLLRTTLLTCFLVHWLSLIDYISLAKLDSTKLSELITKEKYKAFGEGFNHASRQTVNETIPAGKATMGQQVWKALALTTNFRRLGTEWEVKSIIYPQTKLTPVGFVLDVFPKAALSYLLIDTMMHAPPPEPHLITAAKQTSWQLWMLSSEDMAFRVPAVTLFWVSARLVIYVLIQGVLGLPSIALGLSSPDYWPSLFGPLSELYTIRGFWG